MCVVADNSAGSASSSQARADALRLVCEDAAFTNKLLEKEAEFDLAHSKLVQLLKTQKHHIMTHGDSSANGDSSEEADMIGNFINQVSFKAPRRSAR